MEAVGEVGDALAPRQLVEPRLGDAGGAPEGSGKLSGDCRCGIRVLAQIGGEQHCLTVGGRIADRPEGRLEAVDHVARAPDMLPVPADGLHPHRCRHTLRPRPRTGLEDLVLAPAADRFGDEPGIGGAGLDGLLGPMGGAALAAGDVLQLP